MGSPRRAQQQAQHDYPCTQGLKGLPKLQAVYISVLFRSTRSLQLLGVEADDVSSVCFCTGMTSKDMGLIHILLGDVALQ